MFKHKVKSHVKQTMKNDKTGQIIVSNGKPERLSEWYKLGYKRTSKKFF